MHLAEEPLLVLNGNPPRAARQPQCRPSIAQRSAMNFPIRSARRAVERHVELRRLRLELLSQSGTQRGGAPARAIACLTSANGLGDASHVAVVAARVFRGPSITPRERFRLAVQGVACALEDGIQ